MNRTAQSILTVAAFSLFFYATDKPNSDGNSGGGSTAAPQGSPREYVTETCSQVAHNFGANAQLSQLQQDEMWRQYNGKWVRWNVRVGEISEVLGSLQMQFKCSTESLLFDGHAYFDNDQRAALLQIRPNTMVQIEGRLSDHGQLLGLSIRDATLPPGR